MTHLGHRPPNEEVMTVPSQKNGKYTLTVLRRADHRKKRKSTRQYGGDNVSSLSKVYVIVFNKCFPDKLEDLK